MQHLALKVRKEYAEKIANAMLSSPDPKGRKPSQDDIDHVEVMLKDFTTDIVLVMSDLC